MSFYTKTMIWATFYAFFAIAAILIFKHFVPDSPEDISFRNNAEVGSVSDGELLSFARINTQLMELKEDALEQMEAIIADNGMTKSRYNEIASMENDSEAASDATEEELSKAREISDGLSLMQSEMQSEALELMESENLTPERFQELSMELETNIELQNRFTKLTEENKIQ
ncbi:MAG: DUF4168 domain-containing protein [Chitinispirillaceae bacterium]